MTASQATPACIALSMRKGTSDIPDAKIGPDKKGVTRMSYKPEHVVDMASGAIVHVDLNPGDQADGADLADRIEEVEERLNHGLSDPAQPNAPVKELVKCDELVADMGYFQPSELRALHERGIRTVIPDPVPKRRLDRLTDEDRRAVLSARRSAKSASGRALMKRRGELAERPFGHVLDQGGGRRATHRGRVNILKRHLVRTACFNLSLLMRTTLGVGTLTQTWSAAAEDLAALLHSLATLRVVDIASESFHAIREAIFDLLDRLAPVAARRPRFLATSTGC